jgi:hypothetical protein
MLKIGNVITAYHKGFHRITKIEKRYHTKRDEEMGYGKEGEEYNPLVYYITIMDANFKPKNYRERCSDSAYCSVVDEKRIEDFKDKEMQRYDEIIDGIDSLEKLI